MEWRLSGCRCRRNVRKQSGAEEKRRLELEHNNGPQLARYSDCRPGPGQHWAIGQLEPVIAVQTVFSLHLFDVYIYCYVCVRGTQMNDTDILFADLFLQ